MVLDDGHVAVGGAQHLLRDRSEYVALVDRAVPSQDDQVSFLPPCGGVDDGRDAPADADDCGQLHVGQLMVQSAYGIDHWLSAWYV